MELSLPRARRSKTDAHGLRFNLLAQLSKFRLREPCLRHFEKLALLSPDVPLEQRAQPFQQRFRRGAAQQFDEALELAMFGYELGDQGQFAQALPHSRKQNLFFHLEVVGKLQLVTIHGAQREPGHIGGRSVLAKRAASQH